MEKAIAVFCASNLLTTISFAHKSTEKLRKFKRNVLPQKKLVKNALSPLKERNRRRQMT